MRDTALTKDLSGYRELLLIHYYSSAFWSLTLTFIVLCVICFEIVLPVKMFDMQWPQFKQVRQ